MNEYLKCYFSLALGVSPSGVFALDKLYPNKETKAKIEVRAVAAKIKHFLEFYGWESHNGYLSKLGKICYYSNHIHRIDVLKAGVVFQFNVGDSAFLIYYSEKGQYGRHLFYSDGTKQSKYGYSSQSAWLASIRRQLRVGRRISRKKKKN